MILEVMNHILFILLGFSVVLILINFNSIGKIMKYIKMQFPYTTTSNTENNQNSTYEYVYL
jgi:hypothetical protein